MDIIKVFADNVRYYRTQVGLSQEAFAEKCGLHRTYISAVECYRRSISLENIQRIADALGIETYKLLRRQRNCLRFDCFIQAMKPRISFCRNNQAEYLLSHNLFLPNDCLRKFCYLNKHNTINCSLQHILPCHTSNILCVC